MADRKLLGSLDEDTGPAVLDREPLILPDHRKEAKRKLKDLRN